MKQDIMNLDDNTKEVLRIASISDSDLVFTDKKKKELAVFNYGDGDIEISIDDGENHTFVLTKKQIKAVFAWLKRSR